MTGGTLLVHGNVGNEIGSGMRRGLLAVAGQAGDMIGFNMRAGSIFVFGECGVRHGAGMRRGTIGLLGTVHDPAAHVSQRHARVDSSSSRCWIALCGRHAFPPHARSVKWKWRCSAAICWRVVEARSSCPRTPLTAGCHQATDDHAGSVSWDTICAMGGNPDTYLRQLLSCSRVRLFSRMISCSKHRIGTGHFDLHTEPPVFEISKTNFNGRFGRQIRRQIAHGAASDLRAIGRRCAFAFHDLHENRLLPSLLRMEDPRGLRGQRRIARNQHGIAELPGLGFIGDNTQAVRVDIADLELRRASRMSGQQQSRMQCGSLRHRLVWRNTLIGVLSR